MAGSASKPTIPPIGLQNLEAKLEAQVSAPKVGLSIGTIYSVGTKFAGDEDIIEDLREARENYAMSKQERAKFESDTSSPSFQNADAKMSKFQAQIEKLQVQLDLKASKGELTLAQEAFLKKATPENGERVAKASARVENLEALLYVVSKAAAVASQTASATAETLSKVFVPKTFDVTSAATFKTSLGSFYAVNTESYPLVTYNDLHDRPMLDRESAVTFAFQLWCEKLSRGSRKTNKNETPFFSFNGGPGSGKSRVLNALANSELRSDLLSKFGTSLDPTSYKIILNAVGVAVTFNQDMASEAKFQGNPSKGLAARIIFSHFTHRTRWATFLPLVPDDISLEKALELVLEDVGDKHIILCIDELLLSCKVGTEVDKGKLAVLLQELGTALENFPRVLHVVSSLGVKVLQDGAQQSHRSVVQFILAPLSAASVKILARELYDTDIYRQLFEDTYGSPRLFYATEEVVKKIKRGEVVCLKELRNRIVQSDPMRKLADNRVHLLAALRAALWGRPIVVSERADVDLALMGGYLVKSLETTNSADSYLPVMPPLIMACLLAKVEGDSSISPLASHLLVLGNNFLVYDQPADLKFSPKAFENQISTLIQIRCALLSESAYGDVEDSSLSLTTIGDLLKWNWQEPKPRVWGTLAREKVNLHVLLGRGSFPDDVDTPFKLKMLPPGSLWAPERDNFEGIDLLFQAPMAMEGKGNLVVGIQVKYGGDGAGSLDVKTLSRAMIKTAEHKALHLPIDQGRFLFVAAAFKGVVHKVDRESVIAAIKATSYDSKSKYDERAFEMAKRRAFKIAENVIILDHKLLRKLFTPSLGNRLHLKSKD